MTGSYSATQATVTKVMSQAQLKALDKSAEKVGRRTTTAGPQGGPNQNEWETLYFYCVGFGVNAALLSWSSVDNSCFQITGNYSELLVLIFTKVVHTAEDRNHLVPKMLSTGTSYY